MRKTLFVPFAGYSLQIDQHIPNQIDHRIPPGLTTTFS
jgi:hypothetical protein